MSTSSVVRVCSSLLCAFSGGTGFPKWKIRISRWEWIALVIVLAVAPVAAQAPSGARIALQRASSKLQGSEEHADSCTNYGCFQVSCLGGATTSISGVTYAPNGVDPIPNVLVFVPNGTVEPFVDGPADDTESSLVTGDPLVQTTSAADGTFTLDNVPAGTSFPLVLQAGRWRRQLTVPSVTACVNTPVANFNPVSDVFSRFPTTQVEGDIPKMALVTGGVDALECSLRKIGIADTEFTDYTVNATGLSSPGRISLFEGAGNSGASAGVTVHTEDQLVGSTSGTIAGSLLGNYNVLLLPCQGTFGYTTADGRGNAITFAGEGGRIFATHHSDTYLDQDAAIDGAATWRGDANSDAIGAGEATINTSFSSGMTLAQWMQDIGATSTLGQVSMSSLFSDQTGINAPTQSWATFNSMEFGVTSPILQLSFYTPVGSPAASQFGRVMYNEYHVDSTSTNSTVVFPAECTGGLAKTSPFTPQEHMLEYSLFDLMNFAVPVVAPTVSISIANSPPTFTGGDVGDTVTVTVENTGGSAIPITPQVFLTVTLPAGLTPLTMNDDDGIFSCTPATLTCTLIAPWGAGVSDDITITVGIAANVAGSTSSVTATVASVGFSSNVTGPLTITVDSAPAGVVTTGVGVSAGPVELASTGSATTNFAISAGTTIGTISVLTQGATGLDFTNAGSGTCTATTFGSASTCTVNVTFSPTHPGPRLGAVRIVDGGGNLLATQYVTAIGISPQVIFSPGTQSALGGGFSQPYGVVTDSSGNVYMADFADNAVKKIPSGCVTSSCVVTLGGGFSQPYGVAVDGAGNVVVGDSNNFAVKLIPAGCTNSGCVVTLGGPLGPSGVAVDGDGNVFVADTGDDEVVEIPQGCFAENCMITLGGGFNVPSGIALDGNGNVFVTDTGNSAVKELSYTCLSSSCVSVVGGGISQPYGLAIDASGNIFVGDQATTAIRMIPGGCTSSSCVTTLNGTFVQPFGLALDGGGNIFVGDASQTTVAKLDFADAPSLSYPSTQVGASSTAQAVTVGNDGNATLNFTSSGLAAPTDFVKVAGSGTPADCANSGAVNAGANCNLSLEFRPLSAGAHAEFFVLTDNDLNIISATQSIAVSGTGLPAETGLTSTSTALTASPNPASVGQTVTLSATLSPVPNCTVEGVHGASRVQEIPDGQCQLGTVSFYYGETLLGTGSLNASGVATATTTVLPAGTDELTAVYSGNPFFSGSTSSQYSEVVLALTATATTLAASPNPAASGQNVTLTATVAPAPTGSTLGTISFYNGETLLGTAAINASGVATFAMDNPAVGLLSLTAVYSGNSGFAGSTSAPLSLTVNTAYTVTAPPAPVSVSQGGAVAVDVNVPPVGGAYNNLVTLSASGLPPGATATFNPPAVTPGANGAPTVMTIQLAPVAAALFDPGERWPYRRLPLAFLALTLGLCAAGAGGKRRGRLLALLVLLAVAGVQMGCGGGFLGPPTTPPNTYVVTITGTSGSLHASTTVTVVVQ